MDSLVPGQEIVEQGIQDLAKGEKTISALLVSIGAPRLRKLLLPIPQNVIPSPEHALYAKLAAENAPTAHSRYNALIRRLVSFERAMECAS